MSQNIIRTETRLSHPQNPGVWLKHFFSSADNDRLNNVEITIDPGAQIAPHIHDTSIEFMYIISGQGNYLIDGIWTPIQPGDAMKAPQGEQHGFINTGDVPLILFATFSPATR